MMKKDVLNCFVLIFIAILFVGFACANNVNAQKFDEPSNQTATFIKRGATGQFTPAGSAARVSVNGKTRYSRVIYIGEPTAGLLD